tara:strand:+ start:865 stop:1038 length:174 start_codon:yes stop_codon:yes gene_type:complete
MSEMRVCVLMQMDKLKVNSVKAICIKAVILFDAGILLLNLCLSDIGINIKTVVETGS